MARDNPVEPRDGLLPMRVLACTEVETVKLPAKTETFFPDSRVMEDELVSADCGVVGVRLHRSQSTDSHGRTGVGVPQG